MADSLIKAYWKELNNTEVLEHEHGFLSYRVLGKEFYIVDIYVKPEKRRENVSLELAEKAKEIAISLGCSKLVGSVALDNNDPSTSMFLLLKYGYKWHSNTANGMWFVYNL
jgi:GNAT superfamily N-acetyltransferase